MKTFNVCLRVKKGASLEPIEIRAETGHDALERALMKLRKRWGARYVETLEVLAIEPVEV